MNKLFKIAALLLLLSGLALGQTHTYPALDTNNAFTGTNSFAGTTTFNGGIALVGPATFSVGVTFNGSNIFNAGNTFNGANTFSATNTFNGAGIFTSTLSAINFETIRFADQFAGADCGAKINAADAALGATAGEIWVNASCGLTITTAPVIAANHYLRFWPANFTVNAGITLGQNSTIDCGPVNGVAADTSHVGACVLTEGNAVNLPAMITMNVGWNSIKNITLNANGGSNPTGGVGILCNQARRITLEHVSVLQARTHGLWLKSTGTANECGAAKITGNSAFVGNFHAGIFAQNTADVNIGGGTEIEGNGVPANLLTAPTVTVTGLNTVTITAGTQISTDTSLIGTYVRIGTPPGGLVPITAIASTTSFSVGAAAPGTTLVNGAGQAMSFGGGIEGKDSPTFRISGVDIGGNQKGVFSTCTTAGLGANGWMWNSADQVGNNIEEDARNQGSQGGANCAVQWEIDINANGTNHSPDAVFPNIAFIDGGQGWIRGNYLGSGGSNRATYAVSITESVASLSVPNRVDIVTNGSFSSGPFNDTTVRCAYAMIGSGTQFAQYSCGGQASAWHLHDTTAAAPTPDKFMRVSAGSLQCLNAGYSAAICTLTDTGAWTVPGTITGSGFLPNSAGGSDIGSTALPHGNLWLGNAATNNFKFSPATVAAQRVITIPEPLNPSLLSLCLNASTCITQTKRAVTGCTTPAVINNICATPITVTWPVAFADALYSATCTGTTITGFPSAPYLTAKAAGTITVNYFSITAAAASYATIDCIAVHD